MKNLKTFGVLVWDIFPHKGMSFKEYLADSIYFTIEPVFCCWLGDEKKQKIADYLGVPRKKCICPLDVIGHSAFQVIEQHIATLSVSDKLDTSCRTHDIKQSNKVELINPVLVQELVQ
jgi:hypothetical protein